MTLSLPLVVLSKDGSERPVPSTLNAVCNGSGPCFATVSGDFLGTGKTKTYSAGALGLNFDFDLGPSPNSSVPHPIVGLQAPLVVTMQNDPAYFTASPCPSGVNPISGYCQAFTNDLPGFPTKVLGTGTSVGVAPYAAPPCTATTCPSALPDPYVDPAELLRILRQLFEKSRHRAFASIGTDGTTYASTPTPGAGSTSQCPPQN